MTFDEVMAHYRTPAATARALGITRAAVCQWQGKRIPLLRQMQLEVLTAGALKRDPLPIVDAPLAVGAE
jgi:hypothetical protein